MVLNPRNINLFSEILFSFFKNNCPDHINVFIQNQVYFTNNEEALIELLIQSLHYIQKNNIEFFEFCLRIAHQNFKHTRPRVMTKNLRLLYLVTFWWLD